MYEGILCEITNCELRLRKPGYISECGNDIKHYWGVANSMWFYHLTEIEEELVYLEAKKPDSLGCIPLFGAY